MGDGRSWLAKAVAVASISSVGAGVISSTAGEVGTFAGGGAGGSQATKHVKHMEMTSSNLIGFPLMGSVFLRVK